MKNPRKLLIGTWKSDKRLTLKNWHKYHRLTGAKKRQLGSVFGKLILRFTGRRVHLLLDGTKWTKQYQVIAVDSNSVVLRIHSGDLWRRADPITADFLKEMAQPRLQHIHFTRRRDRQYYWIGLGTFCEWFQRQDTQPPGFGQRRARARGRNRVPVARRR